MNISGLISGVKQGCIIYLGVQFVCECSIERSENEGREEGRE